MPSPTAPRAHRETRSALYARPRAYGGRGADAPLLTLAQDHFLDQIRRVKNKIAPISRELEGC